MFIALIFASIYLSLFDLKYHRISNKVLGSLFFFFLTLGFLEKSPLRVFNTFLFFIFLLLGYRLGLGAGDVKLTLLLSIFFLPTTFSGVNQLLTGFVAVSASLIALNRIRGRSLYDSMAMAPAICAAFIWCAR
jgi:Flp pilus assembly protein protease CpaA